MSYHAYRQRGACGNRIPGKIDPKATNAKAFYESYSYSGSSVEETLAAGTYGIILYGAQGGGAAGGLGGYAFGKITLEVETTVYIYVGQQPLSQTGGWNGGGNANGTNGQTAGGGATDIRIGGTALADRVLIAAGGGGRGSRDTRANGHGGGLVGTTAGADGSTPGTGGTQIAGGALNGVLGVGGAGPAGGGGGGGYYGGGAGSSYGGGGGGSSYIGHADITNGETLTGQKTGNGSAIIFSTV